MIKVLITSGGTQEYIDDVRVLTNISTGKLGAKITNKLSDFGFKAYYVCGKDAVLPDSSCYYVERVRTANDALEAMKRIIEKEQIQAVIHSMAVSDFTFRKDASIKLKSNDPQAFVEYMSSTITTNPKIINHIKQWDPNLILVGFKFEVGDTYGQLFDAAQKSITQNGCDLVIANDKEEMKKYNDHRAHFIFSEDMIQKHGFSNISITGKENIAAEVAIFLKNYFLNT